MNALSAVIQAFQKGQRFLIAGHVDPDPDCIGSLLAVDWLLEKMGKVAQPLSNDPILPQWRFLPRIERIAAAGADASWRDQQWDALVVVDCETGRTGSAADWAERVDMVINIDHHVTNEGSGHVNLIRPEAAAAGEIVYDLIQGAGVALDPDVSTLLYAAIMSDTGSFRFSNTTARIFQVAADLVRHGARPDIIAQEIYDTRSWGYVRLLGRALETLERSADGRVAWITLTQEAIRDEGARQDESDGFIQYPRMIDGVEVALFFKELESGSVRVGFRSKGKVDVSQLAQEFGGGGHPRAAGCTLDGPIADATTRVVGRAVQVAGGDG